MSDRAELRRAAIVRIYDVADRTVLVGKDGSAQELSGDSAMLARAVLAFLVEPHTEPEVLAHVEALAGAPIGEGTVVRELLSLLLGSEAIERVGAAPPPARPRPHRPGPRVVLGITGAISTMSTPALVQRLLERGFHVRVAATDEALRFVRAEALEALVHHPVVASMWPASARLPVPHINLAQWADAVVVCPASATTISRLASGDYSSVVAATALATTAPVLVVPSMNPGMLESAPVQRNLEQLVMDGMHVAHPVAGLEVADRPELRVPTRGAAPPAKVVVQLLEAILGARARNGAAAVRSADDWNHVYRHAPAELPWHREDADEDVLAAIDRVAPAPCSVLDIGTGLGTVAIACARRGHRVVATDLSDAALAHARARAGELPIVWLQDDAADTKLHGVFDLAVDRGCLHLLAGEEAAGYAAGLARIVRPHGALVLKTLAGASAAPRQATAYDAERVSALLGSSFALEHDVASTLPGPSDAPQARLFVLRRRDPSA
jgi:SAM-dependent methyltransferase/3-polyprenyl-4-hydroxybenzoate decarboxylase